MTDTAIQERWSLADHLMHGGKAVADLRDQDTTSSHEPRVCFHFSPLEINDDEPWSEQASFCQAAKPLFEALPFRLDVDYVGGTSGVEAWEYVMPSDEWLCARIEPLIDLAEKARLDFNGWSFEPSGGPFISVIPTVKAYDGNRLQQTTTLERTFEGVRTGLNKVLGS